MEREFRLVLNPHSGPQEIDPLRGYTEERARQLDEWWQRVNDGDPPHCRIESGWVEARPLNDWSPLS